MVSKPPMMVKVTVLEKSKSDFFTFGATTLLQLLQLLHFPNSKPYITILLLITYILCSSVVAVVVVKMNFKT